MFLQNVVTTYNTSWCHNPVNRKRMGIILLLVKKCTEFAFQLIILLPFNLHVRIISIQKALNSYCTQGNWLAAVLA